MINTSKTQNVDKLVVKTIIDVLTAITGKKSLLTDN